MNVKQVIVIRTKYQRPDGTEFGMIRGKEIAQCCHASIAFLTRRIDNMGSQGALRLSEAEEYWIKHSFAKICLKVKTEEELLEIEAKAKEAGLECHLIIDSGKTEFDQEATPTCLAIGPDYSDAIDEITGHLELY